MSSIQRHPDYNKEVAVQEAVDVYKKGEQVLACFEKHGNVYAAQVIAKEPKFLSELRDIPFDYMADVRYYIKGESE